MAELTAEVIAAAMAQAEERICLPGDNRCYAFPDRLQYARETRTPKGRCKVGRVVRAGDRESWDVWVEASAGLIKLNPRANA